MNNLMKRAIELAIENVREGGQPFGAVLAKGDEVVAEGVNELHIKHDVSGHAELLAIRRAQRELSIDDLSGFTMYASGEPCPMCLSAMYFVGINDIYYSETLSEAVEVGLSASKIIYEDLGRPREGRSIQMVHMPSENKKPMKVWLGKN